MARELTHTLTHDKWTHRWSCQCGYVLGDGHEALYAQCPLAPVAVPREEDAYIEFDRTIAPRPKRVIGRPVIRRQQQTKRGKQQ